MCIRDSDIADINHPSPFTRIGPGPANSIKPDIVSFGGNAGMKDGRRIENGCLLYTSRCV